jgi:hypothetical protein
MLRNPGTYRRSEKGSALIIALLVVIALTGLGMIGLKHTTFELRQASNAKIAKQAAYTSEMGLMGAMQRFDAAEVGGLQILSERFPDRPVELEFTTSDFRTNGNLFGDSSGSFEDEQRTTASVSVSVSNPRRGPADSGNSIGSFCHTRYTFLSTSEVGTLPTSVRFGDAVRFSSSRTVGHAMVGPLQCDQGQ